MSLQIFLQYAVLADSILFNVIYMIVITVVVVFVFNVQPTA